MKIESQDKERQRGYSKPVCSMIEVVEEEMIATSTDTPTTPEKPELNPPTGEKDETTNPNSAKRYPSFNAWTTWDR